MSFADPLSSSPSISPDIAAEAFGFDRRPIRVLYLSTVVARDTTSGALLIHRHFALLSSRFSLVSAHDSAARPVDGNIVELPRSRLFARISNSRYLFLAAALDAAFGCSVSRSTLKRLMQTIQPDVILTLAEGSLHIPARRLAAAWNCPLVSVFHDWAPTWQQGPRALRMLAERQIRRLYRASDAVLCISTGLRDALGAKPGAEVLPPIPGSGTPAAASESNAPFHSAYAGSFQNCYSHEVQSLCRAFAEAGCTHELRLYGPDPRWPTDRMNLIKDNYRGFLKGGPFEAAISAASALLVVVPFDWEAIARYSFPSKIPEYCRFRKPLLIWAPDYATCVEWAKRSGAALVVNDPDPTSVVRAMARLRDDAALRHRLGEAAGRAADGEFNPRTLQAIFEGALGYAARRSCTASPSVFPVGSKTVPL